MDVIFLQVPPPAPRWVAVVYPFQGVVWVGLVVTLLLLTLTIRPLLNHWPRSKTSSKLVITPNCLSVSVSPAFGLVASPNIITYTFCLE